MVVFALCGALVWLAQFHHFRDFGLYEDDYWFIAQAMGKDLSYLGARLHTALTVLPQGRPLGFFLPDLLSFIGDKLGGLPAIYLLGFLVVTLNTFLSYQLLRSRMPLAPAIVGAAVFCLFPADTTKILLTHDFQLQPSLTFALLSALAYTRWTTPPPETTRPETTHSPEGHGPQATPRARVGLAAPGVLVYVLAAGALLSYESGFLALFALPLFAQPWDRRLPRRLILHAAGLLAVMLIVVLARFVAGESRATSSAGSLSAIIPPFIGSLVLGPTRSLAAMFYGPLKAIPSYDLETTLLAALAFVAFGAILWAAAGQLTTDTPHPSVQPARSGAKPFQLAAGGAAMLVLGYALAFTHYPPTAVVGRGTSVHLGATLGMSVLVAAATWLALELRPKPAATLAAAYLALAVGYYVTIERDFVHSWQLQRAFWQQVAACCTDLQDGTVLLYELNPADEPTFIFTNSWADPLILADIYAFPKTWQNPPRLFSLTQWVDRLEPEGDRVRWWVPGASWDEHWETFPQDNVMLLRRGPDGQLTRVTGTVQTPAGLVQLKPPAPPQSWPPARLYDPLLK